uniref:Uncharacterized protein n=1 Tax=Salix viminalis TaxID=40686 RepID=A0A6N2MMM8_SALVM
MNAITVPSAPVTANFGSQTAFTLAAQLVDGQPEPPCGVIEIGRVNSAKEAGGIAPAPLHSTTPEAQSAVAQTNFPDASVEHCVLAQKRPAHVAGALSEDEAPAANVKPVEDNAGLPGFAITVPSAPVTANFGSQTAFTLAAQLVDGQPEPPCGVIEIGRVNSAKEAGGIAPAPLHSMTPEAQSAVAQTNFPDASVEHCVLAQKRPAHVAGALREDEAPAANVKPVEDNAGLPGFVRAPGQTVYGHLVNSAKDAGGIAPAPLHSMTPEAQSAVAQTNFPDVEHCVLARPCCRALSENEAPVANVKPVEDNCGRPAAVRVPGQTVYGHLFVKEKVTD